MPSPFPGMNPYLENPELWSDFHHRLITAIADLLAPQLEPKYIVAYDRAVYRLQINYNSEPVPALTETEATWADLLLKEQALRST